jgi:DNA-binding GntR family transcriptional regulator
MMNFEHKTVSIADQVFEQLERKILIGEYQRGELLTEVKLSEEFGVSRTPIREALRRLEQEHIIDITARGATVLGILPQDIDDIYEIRSRIEGLASRWMAERVSEEDLAEFRRVIDLQEFYTAKGDADQIKDMDSRFHRMIYEKCGSVSLADTLLPLHKRVMKFRRVSVSDHTRAEESLAEHRGIFEAIAARDGALAEELTVKHIARARASIMGRVLDEKRG